MLRALTIWLLLSGFAMAQHEASVCHVSWRSGDSMYTGSGSLVEFSGRRFVLTNFHVVRDDATGRPVPQLTVRFTRLGRAYQLPYVDGFEGADVVALDASQVSGVPTIRIAGPGETVGRAVAYGHPRGGPMRARLIDYRPAAGETYYVAGNGQRIAPVHFRGDTISGESGGPVITQDGRLVAVMWGGARGVTRCVPTGPIRRLLCHVFTKRGWVCTGPSCRPGDGAGCPGGVCPQPSSPGRVVVSAPPTRPVTPVQRQPQPGCDCKEWRAEVEQRLAALSESQGDIASKLGKLADSTAKIAASVSANSTQISALVSAPGPDLSGFDARLASLENRLGDWQPRQEAETYYALVADRQAGYWPRLRDEYSRAAEVYQGIRLAPPPPSGVGRLPRLVAFRDGTPVGNIGGAREVSEALQNLSRGKRPATL